MNFFLECDVAKEFLSIHSCMMNVVKKDLCQSEKQSYQCESKSQYSTVLFFISVML